MVVRCWLRGTITKHMTSVNRRARQYVCMASFAFAVIGASFYVVQHNKQEVHNVVRFQANANPNIRTNRPRVVGAAGMEASYPSDLSDDRNLVGASHNIFIGKVVGEVKTEGWYTTF